MTNIPVICFEPIPLWESILLFFQGKGWQRQRPYLKFVKAKRHPLIRKNLSGKVQETFPIKFIYDRED